MVGNGIYWSNIKGKGHCCPFHTHVVNKHIYTHTYTPQYSCSEENVVINNDCGGCAGATNQGFNNFM